MTTPYREPSTKESYDDWKTNAKAYTRDPECDKCGKSGPYIASKYEEKLDILHQRCINCNYSWVQLPKNSEQ